MDNQILEKLLDSPLKVKLLKLFLRNEEGFFSMEDIIQRTQFNSGKIKKDLEKLQSIGFLNTKRIRVKCGKEGIKTRAVLAYGVNHNFIFYSELRNLVLKSSAASEEKIKNGIKRLGRIKLAILTGFFINNETSKIDFLLVGDNIKQKNLKKFFTDLESEAGKDIRYVLLTTEEFNYRIGMFDRFIRDILDYPHKKLINKLRI